MRSFCARRWAGQRDDLRALELAPAPARRLAVACEAALPAVVVGEAADDVRLDRARAAADRAPSR